MASKGKPISPTLPPSDILDDVMQTPPRTIKEYVAHIRALRHRIGRHLRFIRGVGTLPGSSAEAKDRAVADFYERLHAFEGQLARLKEALKPG